MTVALQWPDVTVRESRWENRTHNLGFALLGLGLVASIVMSSLVYLPVGFVLFFILRSVGFHLETKRMRPLLEPAEWQLAERGDVPSEAWGSPKRQAMAVEILEKAYISWRGQAFMPDDPMAIVLAAHTYLDDERISVLDLGRAILGRDLTREWAEGLLETTLGETVDFFLAEGKSTSAVDA